MENNQTKEKLLAEIGRLKKELKKKKKYGLVWEDKPEDVVEMCKEKLPVLKEVKSKEIITDKNKPVNLLIEGDNYHALSVLSYTHAKKIDVIYIDPPYNRGTNDFKYNDNYVDEEDAFRHSKWLSFISKRLRLAKSLLKERGVMFVSIDDNEYANLKLLCDEIFGEDRIETYIWCLQDKTEGSFVKTSKNTVRKEHEYLLACFKSQVKFKKYKTTKTFSEGSFSNPDNDPKGPWFSGNISRNGIKSITGSKYFTIETPTGKKYTRNWTLSKEEFEDLLSKEEIYFSNNGDGVPRLKIYESSETYSIQSSLFTDVHTSITGKNELKDIFNGEVPFDYPKPSTLIRRLIEISTTDDQSIVLDFFAGTGTTGYAVLKMNEDDKGKRTFILCSNNEEIDHNGDKKKHRICTDICYPRIEKTIKEYKAQQGEKNDGLGGNLKYYKTAFVDYKESTDRNKIKLTKEAIEMLCVKEGTFEEVENRVGFKIFKNNDHYTGIIFDQMAIKDFKKAISSIKGKLSVYIFSLGDDTFDEEFEDIKSKVKLSPIPETILKVYRKIFK